MLDFELLKKSNIKADKIDLNKSFASFKSNTCNLIIELFLKKEESVKCPVCDSKNIFIRGSRCNQIKSTTLDSKNVIFNVHRRVYKCDYNHAFTQENPIGYENRRISVQKEIMILNALRDKTRTYSSVAKEYELKEEYRSFVATASIDSASVELDILISEFKESRIKEYYPFIHIMEDWHDEIINSFHKMNSHKITNGPMERVNRDIKIIFGISFGSTNFDRVRNRIMFSIKEDSPILAWRKSNFNKKVGKARGKYKIKE